MLVRRREGGMGRMNGSGMESWDVMLGGEGMILILRKEGSNTSLLTTGILASDTAKTYQIYVKQRSCSLLLFDIVLTTFIPGKISPEKRCRS